MHLYMRIFFGGGGRSFKRRYGRHQTSVRHWMYLHNIPDYTSSAYSEQYRQGIPVEMQLQSDGKWRRGKVFFFL